MGLLRNATRDAVVAASVARADGELARVIGFLTKKRVDDEEGIWFPRCAMIHTFGMRTAVDVVFLNDRSQVVKIFGHAKPWRTFSGGKHCAHAIELAPGRAADVGLTLGDVLVLEEHAAEVNG